MALLTSACRRERQQGNIPYVNVNFTVNINNPSYNSLKGIGGWTYYNNAGNEGVILYRKSENTVNAFDRLGVYQPELRCKVYVDSSNIYAVDTCSNISYLLVDGFPVGGENSLPLITYQASLNGTVLTVTN